MTALPNVATFIEQLAELQFDCAFNPYAEACAEHDKADAPEIRRRNLALVLDAAVSRGVESIWIARDLGYRGGRRTGLALTDEVHLGAHAALLGTAPLARSTRGPVVAERTATIIWQMLNELQRPIFLWNVFPLHPHARDDPMLMWLLETLKPKTVIAIGQDAQLSLADLDVMAYKVRHPSYGGQTEFCAGVRNHYGLSPVSAPVPIELF
jgi:hypothetical protein